MNKKRLIFGIICMILYVVTIVLLISFSIETGKESVQTSSGVTNVVGSVVDTIAPDKVNTKKPEFISLVRKIVGHFGLFAVNAFFGLAGLYLLFSKKWFNLVITIAIGITLAIITEILQLHTEGRNYSIKDMLINSTGCIFGLGVAYLTIHIYNRKCSIMVK